jgi:hypothetical protein
MSQRTSRVRKSNRRHNLGARMAAEETRRQRAEARKARKAARR